MQSNTLIAKMLPDRGVEAGYTSPSFKLSKPEPSRDAKTKDNTLDVLDRQTPRAKLGFLDLPGEVRNQIMDLALVPGHVYFSTRIQPLDPINRLPAWVSGYQLLATCRQIYLEGHVRFYSKNLFHLAPGPLVESMKFFGRLRQEHNDLLRKVSIDISFLDLTPTVLERIEKVFHQNRKQSIADADNSIIARYVTNGLRELWTEKITAVRGIRNIEVVKLIKMFLYEDSFSKGEYRLVGQEEIHLEGKEINEVLAPIKFCNNPREWEEVLTAWSSTEDFGDWNETLHLFFWSVFWAVSRWVMKLLEGSSHDGRCGWKGLKIWLGNVKVTTIDAPPWPERLRRKGS